MTYTILLRMDVWTLEDFRKNDSQFKVHFYNDEHSIWLKWTWPNHHASMKLFLWFNSWFAWCLLEVTKILAALCLYCWQNTPISTFHVKQSRCLHKERVFRDEDSISKKVQKSGQLSIKYFVNYLNHCHLKMRKNKKKNFISDNLF